MISSQEIVSALKLLKKQFVHPGAMELQKPYETLVAVILSARTRDEQVLKLLPAFFRAFPTVQALGSATPAQIVPYVNTIGMYRAKAKHIQAMAQRVVTEYHGKIPSTMDALITLPGVGRKTASVVLAACFDTPAIAVDTHVFRVTNRLGWVHAATPEQTEQVLLPLVPDAWKTTVNRVFVKLGRYVCLPAKPKCFVCPLKDVCAFKQKHLVASKDETAVLADIERREEYLEALREKVLDQIT